MNSQGSSSNSFTETFVADRGNDVNNLGFVQSNVNPMASAARDSPAVIDWMGPYSSSMINYNQVNHQELLGGHEWLSYIGASDGSGQGFQVSRSGPNIATFQESGGSFLQGSSSHAHHQNIDLNSLLENGDGEVNQNMGAGLSLSLFNPDGLEANHNPHSSTSSVPVMISSGVSGYVSEGNNSREDFSSDGRRVSCRRRAPDDAHGQLYSGESSRSTQESRNLEWHALSGHENANASLNLSISPIAGHLEQLEDGIGLSMMGAISGILHTSSGAGQEDGSQRNIRMRRTADPQDFVQPSMWSSGTERNSYPQSHSPTAVFSPFDNFSQPSLAATLPVDGTYTVPSFAHAPNSAQNLQSSPWYDLTASRTGASSIPPAYTVNGGSTSQQEHNSMNMPRNTLLAPETERGFMAEYPTGYHLLNGHLNYPGNIASSSQNGTFSGVHFPYAPTRVPEYNMTEQYGQRFQNCVNHFTTDSTGFECRELGGYCPVHPRTSATARQMDLSVRSDVRPVQLHPYYGWSTRPERQTGGYPENSYTLELIGATQRTRRLASEVRNAMALFCIGGGVWVEDIMVIDQSVLYGVPEEDDMDEDMHLDVDNMSYEELLALEEHMGSVSTGLNEEAIMANLRHHTYDLLTLGSPADNESCCICQEEYVNGDDLGKLDCRHAFHFNCIKQWLMEKNSCPICKMRALNHRGGGDMLGNPSF